MVKNACNAGDSGWISGLGRSSGEGIGYPLQHSGLENSMDCIVHGIPKSRTPLSDFHFHRVIIRSFPDGSVVEKSACNAGDRGDMS